MAGPVNGKGTCVCGCASRGVHRHHVISQQTIKREVPFEERRRWLADRRNVVMMSFDCHFAHENASARLPVRVLPDSVFEFALDLLGAGAGYEYLRRHYKGDDPRLDVLLSAADQTM